MIAQRLSNAFWPNPELNESANVSRGNTEVDKLTIGELVQFYAEVKTGPTYCMVTRRVQELLKKFPPHIEDRRLRMVSAMEQARLALIDLNKMFTYAE